MTVPLRFTILFWEKRVKGLNSESLYRPIPLKEVLIENETGILTPIKDPESIAIAVIRLLRDKELSKELGENGRRLVATYYSFTGMLDKIESLYREFLIQTNG